MTKPDVKKAENPEKCSIPQKHKKCKKLFKKKPFFNHPLGWIQKRFPPKKV
jgi:hypothetical protein